MDVPNARSSHDQVVVRGGGLAILLVLVGAWTVGSLGMGGWLPAYDFALDGRILIAVLLVAGISFVDDMRPLPFWVRLGVHGVAAAIAVAGVEVEGFGWLTASTVCVIAWIWVVGYANAFNFMDGINGLALTQSVMAGGFGVVFCFLGGGDGLVPWIAIQGVLAGASLGLLPHNFPRARMFLGDVGSIPLGFLMALSVVAVWQLGGWRVGVALGAMQLNFLLDTTITMTRRFFRGDRIHEAHREHFYQRLLRSGKSHSFVTMAEAALQGVSGLVLSFALYAEFAFPGFITVLVAIFVGWLLFFLFCEMCYRATRVSDTLPGAESKK